MHTTVRMRGKVGVYAGIGVISLLVGLLLGWKLRGVRQNLLKKQREYHALKAEELQHQLNN